MQHELHQDQIDSLVRLFTNGDIEDTLKNSESLILKFPNEAILQNISGACYASLGNFDDAILGEKSLSGLQRTRCEP